MPGVEVRVSVRGLEGRDVTVYLPADSARTAVVYSSVRDTAGNWSCRDSVAVTPTLAVQAIVPRAAPGCFDLQGRLVDCDLARAPTGVYWWRTLSSRGRATRIR